VTLMELLRHLSRLTGVPAPRWQVAYPVGLAVAVASEFWSNHVSGQMPRATVTGVRLARRLMHFDTAKSLNELGLVPRSLDQSLQDAVDWLHHSGHLAD